MRRFFKTASFLLLCGALCCPVAEGRGRNNGQGGASQQQPASQHAPQHNGNQGNNRPGNNRPGNNGNHNGNQGNNRPGNNTGNRPHSGNVGPATPPPPQHNPAPGYGHHPNYGYGAPHRPNLPPPTPWQRPTPPPPGYRPYHGPSISTILGVALGTTLYYALDNLGSRGYNVTGYGNDAIYLNNVTQLGMNWPDATMHYVNGRLQASEFVYSQGYYDMSRYYNAYGQLCSSYGYPTSTGSYGQGGQMASWWGPTGQFITLTYAPVMSYDGYTRYYTTLSFGN